MFSGVAVTVAVSGDGAGATRRLRRELGGFRLPCQVLERTRQRNHLEVLAGLGFGIDEHRGGLLAVLGLDLRRGPEIVDGGRIESQRV